MIGGMIKLDGEAGERLKGLLEGLISGHKKKKSPS